MQLFYTLASTFFCATIHLALCVPNDPSNAASTAPAEVVNMTAVTWTGPLWEDGPVRTLTGPTMDYINRLIRFSAGMSGGKSKPGALRHEDERTVQRRGDEVKGELDVDILAKRSTTVFDLAHRSEDKIVCNNLTYGWAWNVDATGCGNFLRASTNITFANATTSEGMPPVCARVACQNATGVYFCNYASTHEAVATTKQIGRYVNKIVNWCFDDALGGNVMGEAVDGDWWSVQLGAATC